MPNGLFHLKLITNRVKQFSFWLSLLHTKILSDFLRVVGTCQITIILEIISPESFIAMVHFTKREISTSTIPTSTSLGLP